VGAEGSARTAASEFPATARATAFTRRHATLLLASALVAAGTWVVFLHQRAYAPFFTDDGFISLRYAARLLEGKGLTWNDGERVEGYSNLLWVLLCAVPGLFGASLLAGARVIGMLCTAAIFGALIALVRPSRPMQWLGAALAIGMLGASDAVAVWSMGGLEVPLVGALLSWGIVAALAAVRSGGRTATVGAAACFGLVCWARVDGALWPLAAVVGLGLGFRKEAGRLCLTIAGSALLFVVLQLVFRLAYYHDYLPNTAYAKVALTDERLKAGIEHVSKSLFPLAASWLTLASCGVYGLRHERLRGAILLHLVLAASWTAYVVRIGGDTFPAWRVLVYVVVIAASLVACMLGDDLHSPIAPAALRWAAALVTLTAVGSHFNPMNWAKGEVWQWDGQVVGKTLARMFKDARPLVAVDAAGSIPYYTGFPALDMLGLTDRYLAHHRPRHMGSGFMGHELGDASYYLERAPDIICIGVPPCQHAAKFPAQEEMVGRKDFKSSYAPLRFEASNDARTLRAALWVRREGRIGIRTTPSSVVVPSYFLTTPVGAVARLSPRETIEANLPALARAQVERISLAPGSWRLEALSTFGSASITLTSHGRVIAAGDARKPLDFTVSEATAVDLEVVVPAGASFTTGELAFRAGR
jgi:hypothetical protein